MRGPEVADPAVPGRAAGALTPPELHRLAANEDAQVVQALVQHLGRALEAENDARGIAAARSLAAVALGLATRLEVAAAYTAGFADARKPAAKPARTPLERRLVPRPGVSGGTQYVYRVRGLWLTSRELARRVGVTHQAMNERLRRDCTLEAATRRGPKRSRSGK